MANRERLLEAAARVYGEFGFRGATTRRIAEEAGVNEVTLFRLFGSKAALLDEALRLHASGAAIAASLPDAPVDPERELGDWCRAQLGHLRSVRAVIRKAMSEMAEHPEVAPCMKHAPTGAAQQLRRYAAKLTRAGLPISARETSAACAMLMGALMSDAMGREIMPEMYVQPETAAPGLYARLVLRALGCEAAGAAHQTRRRRAADARPRGADGARGASRGSAA
jgi:AcrR family transcriptional regulator